MAEWYDYRGVDSSDITDGTIASEDLAVELAQNIANLIIQQSIDNNPFEQDRFADGAVIERVIADREVTQRKLLEGVQDKIDELAINVAVLMNPIEGNRLSSDLKNTNLTLTISGTDDGDQTATIIIQVYDAAGDKFAGYATLTTWMSTSDWNVPITSDDYEPHSTVEVFEILDNGAYVVQTNVSGLATMDATDADGGTQYFMAEIGGVTYSTGAVVIAAP